MSTIILDVQSDVMKSKGLYTHVLVPVYFYHICVQFKFCLHIKLHLRVSVLLFLVPVFFLLNHIQRCMHWLLTCNPHQNQEVRMGPGVACQQLRTGSQGSSTACCLATTHSIQYIRPCPIKGSKQWIKHRKPHLHQNHTNNSI